MSLDQVREQNLAFLDSHLANAPIERIMGNESPLLQAGIAIVAREVELEPEIDLNEPWLDDRSVQTLSLYSVEIVQDGNTVAEVSSLMPAPVQDDLVRANVYELLIANEAAIETLKVYLDSNTISQRSRPRFN